jgi:serine/threonine-protein kinase HipA
MNVKALEILLGNQRAGILFKYGEENPVIRFVADDAFARIASAPSLSLSMLAEDPQAQRALWTNVGSRLFNGRYSNRNGWLLPAFFQGLLPEGVFREHIAQVRGCDPKDHFEMLAATGRDLPGNVYARPATLTRDELTHLITQDADSLEMSVTEEPMDDGVSVSGVQPKVGVIRQGDRYVGRTKMQDTHIIAKLPVVGYPLLPELEELSLRLARIAGVTVCDATLEPLEKLAVEHGYDLGDADQKTCFLAVSRFDRTPQGRVHVEDFAQLLDCQPEDKYSRSYVEVAAVMLATPSLGEPAVHELLRRLTVNELLGNPDMHLKNLGVIYEDGRTPLLSPAYDIVGYSAYHRRNGHALHLIAPDIQRRPKVRAQPAAEDKKAKPGLTPSTLREFCGLLGLLEKPASTVIRQVVAEAAKSWPTLIAQSALTVNQKTKLLAHLETHPMVQSARKRSLPRKST